uniref:Uncharacterized protein n=1 Tax=Elmago virus TaxID=3077879 RepID=A0AA96H9R8_9VIRU|nr:MAG: hypothetical protein [Elmago virus]
MSAIDTNPEINNSVVIQNPGQRKVVRPATHVMDTDYNQNVKDIRPYSRIPNVTPISWTSLASVSRMISSTDWVLSTTTSLDIRELTVEKILDWTLPLVPPASAINFDSITFTISKNTNAMFQGKLIIAYDPASELNYYSDLFGIDVYKKHTLTQFNYVEFDPRDTESVAITIDNILPFDFIRIRKEGSSGSTGMALAAELQKKYFENYSLGRLIFFPLNKLQTTSTVTSIPVQLEAKLNGFRYSGRMF